MFLFTKIGFFGYAFRVFLGSGHKQGPDFKAFLVKRCKAKRHIVKKQLKKRSDAKRPTPDVYCMYWKLKYACSIYTERSKAHIRTPV